MVAHACDPALRRQTRENQCRFKVSQGEAPRPCFRKGNQTNITINDNKTRRDKQASVQCHVQFGPNNLPQVSKKGRLK